MAVVIENIIIIYNIAEGKEIHRFTLPYINDVMDVGEGILFIIDGYQSLSIKTGSFYSLNRHEVIRKSVYANIYSFIHEKIVVIDEERGVVVKKITNGRINTLFILPKQKQNLQCKPLLCLDNDSITIVTVYYYRLVTTIFKHRFDEKGVTLLCDLCFKAPSGTVYKPKEIILLSDGTFILPPAQSGPIMRVYPVVDIFDKWRVDQILSSSYYKCFLMSDLKVICASDKNQPFEIFDIKAMLHYKIKSLPKIQDRSLKQKFVVIDDNHFGRFVERKDGFTIYNNTNGEVVDFFNVPDIMFVHVSPDDFLFVYSKKYLQETFCTKTIVYIYKIHNRVNNNEEKCLYSNSKFIGDESLRISGFMPTYIPRPMNGREDVPMVIIRL
ncbi:hypothetical protein AKO1_006993 [Acrasis kona]|uniref:Uncharacterized protein n=1 Tax=Acrasis kona TaxID=1008807 RepID=A0AAW2YV89_9EUKA